MGRGANPGLDPRLETLGLKPKVLARLRAVGGDAEFGRLLSVRQPPRWPILAAFLIPVLLLLLALGATVSPMASPPGQGTPRLLYAAALVAGSVVASALIVWWYRAMSHEYRFFEHGVEKVRRGGGSPHRLSYLDVTALTYSLSRRYHNGIYLGTVGVIRLETEKGSNVKGMQHKFPHREKPRGLLRRHFEGVDSMDLVRDAVAEVVAERLALEIAEKGSASWTGSATLTRTGLSIKRILGGTLGIPYETISRVAANGGTLSIVQEGQTKASATLAMNGRNFWPGMSLLRRLLTPRGAAEATESVEEFADED